MVLRPRGVANCDGYPLWDARILRLIDGLPINESSAWVFLKLKGKALLSSPTKALSRGP